MEQTPNNPPTNRLGEGISEEDVLKAISASGYPLQTLVAANLRYNFNYVQEEWSYIDRDSGDLRTLDILATKHLSERTPLLPGGVKKGQVDTGLVLLMECKQSKLPYVFFLSNTRPPRLEFPLVTGLPSLSVRFGNGGSWSDVQIPFALGFDQHSFIKETTYCTSFTKGHRKGKNLELSGNEPFNSLVLPLSKALSHYADLWKTDNRAHNYICNLAVGLGVVDAPMIGVRVSEGKNETALLPWVRVLRHETGGSERQRRRDKLFAIDVVHKDFLQAYLNKHLLPFAEAFSVLVDKHKGSLTSGTGTGVGDEPRLVKAQQE